MGLILTSGQLVGEAYFGNLLVFTACSPQALIPYVEQYSKMEVRLNFPGWKWKEGATI